MYYEHYKGGKYRVLHQQVTNATNVNNGVPMTIYQCEATGAIYVRDKWEFEELVRWPDNSIRPRFQPRHEPGDGQGTSERGNG